MAMLGWVFHYACNHPSLPPSEAHALGSTRGRAKKPYAGAAGGKAWG